MGEKYLGWMEIPAFAMTIRNFGLEERFKDPESQELLEDIIDKLGENPHETPEPLRLAIHELRIRGFGSYTRIRNMARNLVTTAKEGRRLGGRDPNVANDYHAHRGGL